MFSPRRKRSASRGVAHAALCLASPGLLVGCSDDQAVDDEVSDSAGRSAGVASEPDGTFLPPWPAPTDVPQRVAAAGLDLGPMGMAEHYHLQLQVVVDGAEVPVPANIGVDPATGAMSALHTHTADGEVHIEADVAGEVFTLAQLFTQWGVQLGADRIGGARTKVGEAVTVIGNGKPYTGDPAELRLEPNEQIVVELQ